MVGLKDFMLDLHIYIKYKTQVNEIYDDSPYIFGDLF